MIKSLLDIKDLNYKDIVKILDTEVDSDCLKSKTIGCVYQKPSTRTRMSFAVAINQLKGFPLDIKLDDLNFSRSESIEDTFKALGLYLDGLVFRTNAHDNLIIAKNFLNKPLAALKAIVGGITASNKGSRLSVDNYQILFKNKYQGGFQQEIAELGLTDLANRKEIHLPIIQEVFDNPFLI